MSADEQWFPDRSDFISSIIKFIDSAQKSERNVGDELEEALEEGLKDSGLSLGVLIDRD